MDHELLAQNQAVAERSHGVMESSCMDLPYKGAMIVQMSDNLIPCPIISRIPYDFAYSPVVAFLDICNVDIDVIRNRVHDVGYIVVVRLVVVPIIHNPFIAHVGSIPGTGT